jgi:hypothetical protein
LKIIPVYPSSQSRSALHSRLRAILDPLEKHWQFIEVRSRGRKSEVSLTEQGECAGDIRVWKLSTPQKA